jgi:hypothetical protein
VWSSNIDGAQIILMDNSRRALPVRTFMNISGTYISFKENPRRTHMRTFKYRWDIDYPQGKQQDSTSNEDIPENRWDRDYPEGQSQESTSNEDTPEYLW